MNFQLTIRDVLLLCAIVALLICMISIRRDFSVSEQQLAEYKHSLGFLNSEQTGFNVTVVGDLLTIGNSTQFCGCHLIRVTPPVEDYQLEINLLNGESNMPQTERIDLPSGQLGISITDGWQDDSGRLTSRFVLVHDTNDRWSKPVLSSVEIKYAPHLSFNLEKQFGEVHEGSILNYFFLRDPAPPFDSQFLNEKDPVQLAEISKKYGIPCVYFRLAKHHNRAITESCVQHPEHPVINDH